jgi:solute carrier family 25 phosphate transporter 3
MRLAFLAISFLLPGIPVCLSYTSRSSRNHRIRHSRPIVRFERSPSAEEGRARNEMAYSLRTKLLVLRLECSPSTEEGPASKQGFHNKVFKLRRTLAFLLCLIPLFYLLPAGAVDHPADYVYLNIPNPIPNADPRYFLSGGLCAAFSHGVTTPIDVVKTKMQADPETYNQGLLKSAAAILEKDGSQALLGGLGPTVVGYGLEGAIKFGLYESLKPEMARLLPFDNPAFPYLVASVAAGAAAAVMLCPMESLRIRQVTDPNPSSADSLLTGLSRLVEESGVFSLFTGLPAMLSKQVPYTIGKQVSFDVFAVMLYAAAANANLVASDVKLEVLFGAAFLASIVASILSHPGDVVLTATYKNAQSNLSFAEVVSGVLETRGPKGFFSGITARFVHVGCIITSQLVLYDTFKQLLGLSATGT